MEINAFYVQSTVTLFIVCSCSLLTLEILVPLQGSGMWERRGSETFGTNPVSLPLLLPSLPVWHHLGAEGSLDGLIQAV